MAHRANTIAAADCFTDHEVAVEASHDPRMPFQARHSYSWNGRRYSNLVYYASRSGAARRAKAIRAGLAA